MRIELDPNNAQGDLDTTDNVYIFNFEILERPDEPVLRYLPGAVTTLPVVPLEDQLFEIRIRIDNLGKSDAFSLDVLLEYWSPKDGWFMVDEESISFVPGATIESGHTVVDFNFIANDVGVILYRATLTGDGVESDYSLSLIHI